jgi:hypothetical protein
MVSLVIGFIGEIMKYGLLFLFFVSSTSFAEKYICLADIVTGFRYSETSEKWVQTKFIADDKYIISESDSESYAFKVVEIGSKYPLANCKEGFNEYGFLFCDDFKFQKKNGRYIRSYTVGYFNVLPSLNEISDSTSDTPFLEIGKCSPI